MAEVSILGGLLCTPLLWDTPLLRGQENLATLKEMVSSQVSKMEEMVHELNRTMYNIEEHDYQGRVFLCGDQILNYKVNGRDAPTCTLPTRHPCPHCNANAPEVRRYAAVRPPTLSADALFDQIPIYQRPMDCAHGMVNLLYGVQQPVVKEIRRVDCKMTETQINDFLDKLNMTGTVTYTGDVEEGTGYPRSISNALKFYDTRAYNAIIAKVQASCGTQLLWRGKHYQKADLLRAMPAHTKTMLDVVYTQKPKAVQINSVVTAAQKLRDLLHLFDAPATPWGHVWTCHVPQYLQELGTPFPFLCHGFEGRWRQLKTDIKLSTHWAVERGSVWI